MSNSARYPAIADLAYAPRPLRGEECRKPKSRLRGVTTTAIQNSADIRAFFDQCAASGFAEQHGHPQRLLEYRLGLVRSLAQLRAGDVVLDLGCGNGHHLLARPGGSS